MRRRRAQLLRDAVDADNRRLDAEARLLVLQHELEVWQATFHQLVDLFDHVATDVQGVQAEAEARLEAVRAGARPGTLFIQDLKT